MSWSPFRDPKTRARWRDLLMREQNGLCALCGHRIPPLGDTASPGNVGFEPTFDHILPRARGGDDALGNLRLVHRCCNHIRGDANGLKRIPPVPRSLRMPPPKLPPRVRINAQGEAWCRNRDWKRAYPTLTSAWVAVFCSFVQTGRVNTPYWCGRSRFTKAIVCHRISPNTWLPDPRICWVGSRKNYSRGCGWWHLTSLAGHVLAAAERVALPIAMGWEAYHCARDGSWVRKDRECIRSDGLPKKRFASREEAERLARAMSVPEGKRGRRYHTYVCSSGHIHVGAVRD